MMKNDWIIANINNPNFTAADFKNIGGFSLENTELLPMEKYLKSEKILENPLFQNKDGKFSLEKFKDFYDTLAIKFQNFEEDSSLDNFEYNFWDPFRKPTSRVKNPNFNIFTAPNPTHQSYGVVGINTPGERTKSDFELAEKLKIYDWETLKFKDETPEDYVLFKNPIKFFKNIFSDPLVLAKYEEDVDEIDPITGQMVHHKKGENKVNLLGEYYFETLGGRSVVGKQVLSLGDLLTEEDSAVNKYDFFDSDDLEKSPAGVIAKNLVAIAPMIFLGPVGTTIYSSIYITRELAKALPMLNSIGSILSDGDITDKPLFNTLAAYGLKFTGGTSEYSKQKTFSFENFGNLISDVALLWGLLKAIALGILKLTTGNKELLKMAEAKAIGTYEKQATNIINRAYKGELSLGQVEDLAGIKSIDDIAKAILSESWKNTAIGVEATLQAFNKLKDSYIKRQRLGLDLSLAYMALISNTDVYESMLLHGATKKEAALVALGSMVGMFSVDKFLDLGNVFFDDVGAQERRLYRRTLLNRYNEDVVPAVKAMASNSEAETNKGLLNFFKLGKNKAIDFVKNYRSELKDRSLSISGKALGEGLEEVSEEVNTDLWKTLYEVAGQFGYASLTDVGAWDNMLERYSMSFFGGAIGGAMYGGIEAIKNPSSASDANSKDALYTIIRLEGSSRIIKELEKLRDDELLGSKDLSMRTQEIIGENGQKQVIFLKADKDNISLNEFNFQTMKLSIQDIEKIINGNQLNISDDRLFERLLTSSLRIKGLKDYLKETSYISGYYQDYLKSVVNETVDNEAKIQELQKISDPKKRTESYEEDLRKLLEKRKELEQQKEDFFSVNTQRYMEKMMFISNPAISGSFIPPTFENYVLKEYKKPLKYLSEEEKALAQEKYDAWVKTKKVEDVDKAFNSYKGMSSRLIPVVQELSQADVKLLLTTREAIAKDMPLFGTVFYDEKIEPEVIDIELTLKELRIIKGEEYDKPWKDDSSKSNKAFLLLLEENPSLFFEIVKDLEDGFWSIHFKTGNNLENHTDLTEELKLRLFEAAAYIIPEGDKLSTWGSLTKGGVHGINRFKDFKGFRKAGTRKVKLRAGLKKVQIDFDDTNIPSLEKLLEEKTKEVSLPILRNLDGTSDALNVHYSIDENNNIDITLDYNRAFLIDKSLIPSDSSVRSNEDEFSFDNLKLYGGIIGIKKENGEWYTEVAFESNVDSDGIVTEKLPGLLAPELVPKELRGDTSSAVTLGTTYNAEEDILIPIWLKLTGETLEEYENRRTLLEGETPEQFEERKKARSKALQEQHADQIIKSILELINNNTVIDSNTFRYIMAKLGVRVTDLVRAWTYDIGLNTALHGQILEILTILNDDLSNVEDVWKQIDAKIVEYVNDYLSLLLPDLIRISKYDGLKTTSDKLILFLNILDFINELTQYEFTDKDLETKEYFNLVDLDEDEENEAHDLVIYDLRESREALASVDFVNITKLLKDLATSEDERPEYIKRGLGKIKLYNGYTITYPSEDGQTVTINVKSDDIINSSAPDGIKILEAILADINSEYAPNKVVGYSEEIFDELYKKVQDKIKPNFDNTISRLQRDPKYKTLLSFQEKLLVSDNFAVKLLNSICSKLGENFGSIEDTLKTIYEYYKGLAAASDFVLSDSLIEALEKASMFLDLATSVIVGASTEDSYGAPWAFNKTINEWNREHRSELKEEIEDLPELDEDISNVTLSFISSYQDEINAWIEKARATRINKQKMFKEFDIHFENVKLKFFVDYRDKWITEDGNNLLEGVVEKPEAKDLVLEYERALHRNVLNLLKEGKSVEYIFDAFKNSINWEQAATLKTSRLDNNLQELTDYDKFIYIISTIAENPDNFYYNYKKYVEKFKDSIAPLSFLKHVIKILSSHENNPEIFNEFLRLFKNITGLELPILENTLILSGIGGSGKSSVSARYTIQKNSWVCGPTTTLITNLEGLGTNLKSYSVKDLLKLILKDLYDEKLGIKKDLVTLTPNDNGGKADISKLQIDTYDNPPVNLIIDEATLVSNAELQAISLWCTLNNVKLVLIGDENQNGNNEPGNNFARETVIAVRTPKMLLSLREGNIWKYQNLLTLMNMEDQLRDTNTRLETSTVRDRLINSDLKKFGLKYYFKEGTLTGDMIVETIIDEQLATIPANSDSNEQPNIKFIGSESSPVYLKLKESGKNIGKAYSLEEIQGLEAEYIICDIDWSNLSKFNGSAFKLLDFMRSLYTVITRSKQGSIIINNGLNNVIGGSFPQSYSTDSIIIDKEAVKNFSEYELKWLNSLTLNPENITSTELPTGISTTEVIDVKLPDEEPDENIKVENKKELEKEYDILPDNISELPILVYANFSYLGININDEGDWVNEDDSYRDVGIFLRNGDKASKNKDKRNYADLLFDLKSIIIHEDVDFYNSFSTLIKQQFSKKDLENIKYFVVGETYNSLTHHLIVEEQGLEELKDGEQIYTLQARLKNKKGNDCIITLGVLPKSGNFHKEITIEGLNRRIEKLLSTPNSKELIEKLQEIIEGLNNGSAIDNYLRRLNELSGKAIEIDKPEFTKFCGLSRIRSKNSKGEMTYHSIRLSEITLEKNEEGKLRPSNKSRFNARTSNYVVSPIYVSMDKSDPHAGKHPCIFVSDLRRYDPLKLADIYEEEVANKKVATVRKIMLDPAGVSFESLFDYNYAETFLLYGKSNKSYSFPFEVLPVGVRMYTALHNFRAYLREFTDLVDKKFGKDLVSLEKKLKEESRLFNIYKEENKTSNDEEEIPKESAFRTWLANNTDLINTDIVSFKEILEIWDFNDNDLKNVKLFRLGYNERNGVYVRHISEDRIGNYINPQVAQLYLGTVESLFKLVIDKIIPKNSVNPTSLIDHRISKDRYEKLEENWVKHLKKSGQLVLNIIDADENGQSENIVPIKIEARDKLRALPLVLTLITKNLQARLRMDDPDSIFEGYDSSEENSPYKITLGGETLSYLDILEGGLGDIRKGRSKEPGIIDITEDLSNADRRLLNMFNIAFHGTVATGGNDFTKPVSKMHAEAVIFPKGIFVDPILGGVKNENKKYRIVSTNPKYYLINMAPTSSKVYITLNEKSKTTEEPTNNGETNNAAAESNNPLEKLHEKLNTIVGSEVDLTGEAKTPEGLVKLALDKINLKLSEHYFSASGRFSTPNDLLNLTVSLTLNEDGSITENKVKDFEILKNKGNFTSVKKEGNSYILNTEDKIFTITFSDTVKVKMETLGNSEFKWSIKDALETKAISNNIIMDPKNKTVLDNKVNKLTTEYSDIESFRKALTTFLNNLKSTNKTVYDDFVSNIIDVDESEDINRDVADELIGILNSC